MSGHHAPGRARFAAWRTLARRERFRTPRLAVFTETVQLPDGRVVEDYDQLEMPEFAVVVAEATDGRLLAERQYKHGLRRETLTLPGGQIEPGETPLAAARRELLEETGYGAAAWSPLGSFRTHANQGGGTVHYFHARGAVPVRPPASGDLEDMAIEFLSPAELLAALRADEFQVLADLAAVLLALLKM